MGDKVLNFNNIPEKSLVRAVKKRDILKARILKRSEKLKLPKGSPDVYVESPLGYRTLLSRDVIMRNFRHINNNKIKFSGWRTGKAYFITRDVELTVAVIYVPLNYSVVLDNGKSVTGGHYIVCYLDSEGNIDKSTASIINKKLFRKMFNILHNKTIEKYNEALNKAQVSIERNIHVDKEIKNQTHVNKQTEQTEKFKAVGKLLNENNKIVGFVIQGPNIKNKHISKKEMMALCNKKLVSNIVVATKEPEGTMYLRGNGIKIEELQSVYI